MTQNASWSPDLPMHKQKQTGWPAIGILVVLFAGVFAAGCVISGSSVEPFYREWAILTWIGLIFVALCILAELSCLKCPDCRSRAIALVSAEEVDRWIGQRIVNEDTVGVAGFQTFGESKFRGIAGCVAITGSVAITRRTIPVTKRCVLKEYRCDSCGREFERRIVEEMR